MKNLVNHEMAKKYILQKYREDTEEEFQELEEQLKLAHQAKNHFRTELRGAREMVDEQEQKVVRLEERLDDEQHQ